MGLGFTGPQVSAVIGIPYATLDSWVRTGFFIPSLAQASGRGTRRLYSLYDLVVLQVINVFRNHGVNQKVLGFLIERFKYYENVIVGGNQEQMAVTDGQSFFYIAEDKDHALDLYEIGKPAIIIPVGEIRKYVDQQINDLGIEPIESEFDGKVKVEVG